MTPKTKKVGFIVVGLIILAAIVGSMYYGVGSDNPNIGQQDNVDQTELQQQ